MLSIECMIGFMIGCMIGCMHDRVLYSILRMLSGVPYGQVKRRKGTLAFPLLLFQEPPLLGVPLLDLRPPNVPIRVQRIEAYNKEQVLKKMEEDNRKLQELQVLNFCLICMI